MKNKNIFLTGPTQNTVEDFWLMVWQEHVEQIVMLTNLKEGPKVNSVINQFLFVFFCVFVLHVLPTIK